MRRLPVIATLVLASFQSAYASDQVGTLTQVEGSVKLFTNPGKEIQGPPPHALFEGEYFSVRDAKKGDHVPLGAVLRTAPSSKARLIFDNGDQYLVGPGTAFRVFWDKDSAKAKDAGTSVSLMYGRFRGVVEKGGPRSHLMIHTRSATMGVRGTDFFIADSGEGGATEISTLRGSVAVTPAATPAGAKPKTIEVTKGLSAAVPSAPPSEESAPQIAVRKTTQEELTIIQKVSTAAPKPAKAEDELKAIPEDPKVKELEKKAAATLLKDIKNGDPELYKKVVASGKPTESAQDLDTQAVESLKQAAPKAPETHKPGKSELEDLENGAYEKYFKTVD